MSSLIERILSYQQQAKRQEDTQAHMRELSIQEQQKREGAIKRECRKAAEILQPQDVLANINESILDGMGNVESSEDNLKHTLSWGYWDRSILKGSEEGGHVMYVSIGKGRDPYTDTDGVLGIKIHGVGGLQTNRYGQGRKKRDPIEVLNGDFIPLSSIHDKQRIENAYFKAYTHSGWSKRHENPDLSP